MKRFKGTKNKWKVVIPDHIGCTNVQFGDDIFNGFIEVWHHQSSKEEATANAHLICAAPDLLYALEIMVGDIEQMPDKFTHEDKIRIARKAINKALGHD